MSLNRCRRSGPRRGGALYRGQSCARTAAFARRRLPAGRALEVLRAHEVSGGACAIGEVSAGAAGRVVMRSVIGGRRVVDMLSGEQLPRIC